MSVPASTSSETTRRWSKQVNQAKLDYYTINPKLSDGRHSTHLLRSRSPPAPLRRQLGVNHVEPNQTRLLWKTAATASPRLCAVKRCMHTDTTPLSYLQTLHVAVELLLPLAGQVGEDGVVRHPGPVLLVQPPGQHVTTRFQQQLHTHTHAHARRHVRTHTHTTEFKIIILCGYIYQQQ